MFVANKMLVLDWCLDPIDCCLQQYFFKYFVYNWQNWSASGCLFKIFFIYLLCIDADGVLGRVPQSILDDEDAQVLAAHENCLDLQNLKRISENAYKQYLKSRPNPSPESIKRVKTSDLSSIAVHPLLGLWGFYIRLKISCLDDLSLLRVSFSGIFPGSGLEKMELERLQIVDSIKAYKSKSVSK